MAVSPLIHASFFFILPIIVLPRILKRLHLGIDVRLVVLLVFLVMMSFTVEIVASFVGARQVNYYDFEMTSVSGLGFVFWLFISGLFVAQGKKYIMENEEALSILIFYSISYYFNEVAARIFESGMPLVLLAGLVLTSWRRWAFISTFLLYGMIQWAMRLSSPMPF